MCERLALIDHKSSWDMCSFKKTYIYVFFWSQTNFDSLLLFFKMSRVTIKFLIEGFYRSELWEQIFQTISLRSNFLCHFFVLFSDSKTTIHRYISQGRIDNTGEYMGCGLPDPSIFGEENLQKIIVEYRAALRTAGLREIVLDLPNHFWPLILVVNYIRKPIVQRKLRKINRFLNQSFLIFLIICFKIESSVTFKILRQADEDRSDDQWKIFGFRF